MKINGRGVVIEEVEKRQALHMVPVAMGKADGAMVYPANSEVLPQFPYACPRVKDNNIASISDDFNTGGIPSELHSIRC